MSRSIFAEQQFCILPGAVPADVIQDCLELAKNRTLNSWTIGDASSHAWAEMSAECLLDFTRIASLSEISEVLGRKIASSYQWLNVYGDDQYIDGHKDKSGDAQLLACIAAPSITGGGQLWLHNPENIIPLGAGDALLFNATKLLHGTTPVLAGTNSRRVTLVTRFWLTS